MWVSAADSQCGIKATTSKESDSASTVESIPRSIRQRKLIQRSLTLTSIHEMNASSDKERSGAHPQLVSTPAVVIPATNDSNVMPNYVRVSKRDQSNLKCMQGAQIQSSIELTCGSNRGSASGKAEVLRTRAAEGTRTVTRTLSQLQIT